MSELFGFRPAGVVFDCDGLLVDTEPSWTVAEAALFAARGLPYGPAEKIRFIGKSVPDSVALMAVLFGEPGSSESIQREVLASVEAVIGAQAEAMPGAVELVGQLAGRLPIAVASNSPRAIVEMSLRRAGLAGSFDAVVAADEVLRPKPFGDLYLEACVRLGVAAPASVAFEDTTTGVAAAKAAGMFVVGIPTLDPAGFVADLVLESLADERLREWSRTA